jgi:hypothetical protein
MDAEGFRGAVLGADGKNFRKAVQIRALLRQAQIVGRDFSQSRDDITIPPASSAPPTMGEQHPSGPLIYESAAPVNDDF